jgi:hypothetical protein
MMSAIQNTIRIYCGREFNSFEIESYAILFNMIKLLKQKAIDKEKLAKDRMLRSNEIEIFGQLRGDSDLQLYNERLYEQYLSKFVNRGANMKRYRLLEMIKPDYVKLEDVRKMIDNKYKRGNFNIKSQEELDKLCQVAANVFHNIKNLKNVMKMVAADYTRSLNDKLYEISSNVTNHLNTKT